MSWRKQWKESYKQDPQSLEPFGIWLRFVKGWSQLEIQNLDLEDEETFVLLEEYGQDKEIEQLTNKCLIEIGEVEPCQ